MSRAVFLALLFVAGFAAAQGYNSGGYVPSLSGGGGGGGGDPYSECTADSEFLVCTGSGTGQVEDAATSRASMGAQAQGDVLDDWNSLAACTAANEVPVCAASGVFAYQDGDAFRTAFGFGTLSTADDLRDVPVDTLGTPTITDAAAWTDAMFSAGRVADSADTAGFVISDNGDGTVAITGGQVAIRATDDSLAPLLQADIGATASLALTDGVWNYIYVDYNAGTPQVVATTTYGSDFNTQVQIGSVYREGTTAHINQFDRMTVSDTPSLVRRRIRGTDRFGHESGGIVGDGGSRTITVTAGEWWDVCCPFSTAAFDSGGGDSFTYYYRDGVGGWTALPTATTLTNTNYDDGSGTLAALTGSRYGVSWIYIEQDGDVAVLYGQGNYTANQANAATAPATVPTILQNGHGTLIGKAVVQKDATEIDEVQTAFTVAFSGGLVSAHNDLSGLQGGTAGEYYHLTSAELTDVQALGTASAEDVGTSTGNVVQLIDVGGSPGLPVVDGSNLTGISGGGGSTTYHDAGNIASATGSFAGDVVMGDTSASGGTWTITAGSAMNVGTGVWTAPAAGDYVFASACRTSTSPSDGANAIIEVDGTRYGQTGSWQSTRAVAVSLSGGETARFRCYHTNNFTEGGTGGSGGLNTYFSVTSVGGVSGKAIAALDTEYATNDTFLGKPVYETVVDVGACPGAATKSVSTGLGAGYVDEVLDVRLLADNGTVFISGTYHGGSTIITARYDDGSGEVDVIGNSAAWAAYSCKVVLVYTK